MSRSNCESNSLQSMFGADFWPIEKSSGDYFEDDMVKLTTAFECGNGVDLHRIGHNYYSFNAVPEAGTDHPFAGKSCYFCLGMLNKTESPLDLLVDVRRFTHDIEHTRHIILRTSDIWTRVPQEWITLATDEKTVRFCLVLPPRNSMNSSGVFASNCFWHSYTTMTKWLQKIVRENPSRIRLRSLGKTHQGRDVLCVTVTDQRSSSDRKRRFLVCSTLQPSEIGGWASRAIIEFLLSDSKVARDILDRWIIDIVPQPNPDGVVLGTGMVNSLGSNPMFEFRKAADGESCSKEARMLWRLAEETKPLLYLELHSYYQDNRASYGPYIFPSELYEDEERARLGKKVDSALISISPGEILHVPVGTNNFGQCLPYLIREHFNTISYFYKLHSREGLADNLNQAVRVFQTMLRAVD